MRFQVLLNYILIIMRLIGVMEANKFREELANLLDKYEATLCIEVNQTYAGVQGVDFTFDIGLNCGYNLSLSHFAQEVTGESVRRTISKK